MRYLLILCLYLLLLLLVIKPFPVQETVTTRAYFCQETDCAATLIELLRTDPDATCAFYDVSEPTVRAYLQASDHTILTHESGFIETNRPGLMHHKFCVLDDTVVTGSYNPTERGTYFNDNYLLVIRSPTISDAYRQELNHLRGGRSPRPIKVIDHSTTYHVFFCPQHDCERRVARTVSRAERSVDLLSFTFTSRPLIEELELLQQSGVRVRMVQERRQAHLSEVEERLAAAGAEVRFDNNNYTMHGKVWIIDNTTLILGSYNPTHAATSVNDENIVIVSHADTTAFMAEFERIWTSGSPI